MAGVSTRVLPCSMASSAQATPVATEMSATTKPILIACRLDMISCTWDFLDGPWPTTVAGLADDSIADRGIDKRLSWPVQGAVGRFGVMMLPEWPARRRGWSKIARMSVSSRQCIASKEPGDELLVSAFPRSGPSWKEDVPLE